jgi:hypothetical protein
LPDERTAFTVTASLGSTRIGSPRVDPKIVEYLEHLEHLDHL